MRNIVVSLLALFLFAGSSSRASRFDDRRPDQGWVRPLVASAQEARVWLFRGNVTLQEFSAATGLRPRPDGPAYRWQFPDGAFITVGLRLPNGDFIIECWGPAPAK